MNELNMTNMQFEILENLSKTNRYILEHSEASALNQPSSLAVHFTDIQTRVILLHNIMFVYLLLFQVFSHLLKVF